MTLDDYMSKEKFPVTSRSALSARQQFMIDAYNHDQLLTVEAHEMTPEQKAIYAELSAKVAAQPALLREMDAPH